MAAYKNKKRIPEDRHGVEPSQHRRDKNGGLGKDIIGGNGAPVIRYRAIAECSLDAYFMRGHICERGYKAGIAFREAYLRHIFRHHAAAHHNPFVRGKGRPSYDAIMVGSVHSERLLRAATAALSAKQSLVIIAVCGHDEWAGQTAKVKTLRRGLERLANLWMFL